MKKLNNNTKKEIRNIIKNNVNLIINYKRFYVEDKSDHYFDLESTKKLRRGNNGLINLLNFLNKKLIKIDRNSGTYYCEECESYHTYTDHAMIFSLHFQKEIEKMI